MSRARARASCSSDDSGRCTSSQKLARSVIHAAPGTRLTNPGHPSRLLPGQLFLPVKEPFAITKETYSINDIDIGKLYHRTFKFPLPVLPSLGLVVCCHGQVGSLIKNENKPTAHEILWEYLAQCLAANGFVVASIRHFLPPGKPDDPAPPPGAIVARDQFLKHIAFLIGESEDNGNIAAKFKLFGKPLALVGASEGASGAILAAQRISQFAIPTIVSFVNAVIALAPTDKNTSGNYTEALLVLQGTHDGDAPVGAQSIVSYEKANPASSKFFMWMHGANHIRMLDTANAGDEGITKTSLTDPDTQITSISQHFIVKNYAFGFLKWRMTGDPQYRPLFIGDGSLDFKNSGEPAVQSDNSKGLMRVFPRYDASNQYLCEPEDIGLVTFNDMFQVISGGTRIASIPGSPAKYQALQLFTVIDGVKKGLFGEQATKGFWLAWDKTKKPKPVVQIPSNIVGTPEVVEFQAVLADKTNPKTGLALPTQITFSANGKSGNSKVILVNIPAPLVMKGLSLGVPITRAVLSTIRIPLALYELPPGATVTSLRLNFYAASASSGRIGLAEFRTGKILVP